MNATTTTTTATDQRPTCCQCGSHNVETMAWTDYTADGVAHIVDGDPPHADETGNWCHDCQEHVYLDFPTTTPADDARRQAANAAREHAGDMLELLRTLTGMAYGMTLDMIDPAAHAGAIDRARQLIARIA